MRLLFGIGFAVFTFLVFECLQVESQKSSDCVYKYLAINTVRTTDKVSISCYSTRGDNCKILYYSPGHNGDGIEIGTLGGNESKIFSAKIEFGGILRSNTQFDAKVVRTGLTTEYVAQLPRASDAGTLFAPLFAFRPYSTKGRTEECAISALTSSANITFNYGTETPEYIFVDSYETVKKSISFTGTENVTVRMTSSSPIIITCLDADIWSYVYYTWQPIVLQDLFVYLDNEYMSLSLTNCQTNEPMSNYNDVFFHHGAAKGSCTKEVSDTGVVSFVGEDCVVTMMSFQTTLCLSSMKFSMKSRTRGVGLPDSKTSTRFETTPFFGDLTVIAYTSGFCEWYKGSFSIKIFFIEVFWNNTGYSKTYIPAAGFQSSIVDCYNEYIYVYANGVRNVVQSSGYQLDMIWSPFFEAQGCPSTP